MGTRDHIYVVPTPVGMDRLLGSANMSTASCPHACGDGPESPNRASVISALSPRLWGWTDRSNSGFHLIIVVPTPVGMDRIHWRCAIRRLSCPHACGDGPGFMEAFKQTLKLSPRLWGWTAGHADGAGQQVVVPTPVGMDLHGPRMAHGTARCPHACGDGPVRFSTAMINPPLSPRLWGWTE